MINTTNFDLRLLILNFIHYHLILHSTPVVSQQNVIRRSYFHVVNIFSLFSIIAYHCTKLWKAGLLKAKSLKEGWVDDPSTNPKAKSREG